MSKLENLLQYSHKNRQDSLEGSLYRVSFAAELMFLKVLVPRLPQHTSSVNIECAEILEWWKQLYKWPASWSTDIS